MTNQGIDWQARRNARSSFRQTRSAFVNATLGALAVLCFGQMQAHASDSNGFEPVAKPVVQMAPNNVQKSLDEVSQACASWLAASQPPGSVPPVLQEPDEEVCKFVANPTGAQDGYLMTGAMLFVAVLIPVGFLLGFFWTAFRFGELLFRKSIASRFDQTSWHWRT